MRNGNVALVCGQIYTAKRQKGRKKRRIKILTLVNEQNETRAERCCIHEIDAFGNQKRKKKWK